MRGGKSKHWPPILDIFSCILISGEQAAVGKQKCRSLPWLRFRRGSAGWTQRNGLTERCLSRRETGGIGATICRISTHYRMGEPFGRHWTSGSELFAGLRETPKEPEKLLSEALAELLGIDRMTLVPRSARTRSVVPFPF